MVRHIEPLDFRRQSRTASNIRIAFLHGLSYVIFLKIWELVMRKNFSQLAWFQCRNFLVPIHLVRTDIRKDRGLTWFKCVRRIPEKALIFSRSTWPSYLAVPVWTSFSHFSISCIRGTNSTCWFCEWRCYGSRSFPEKLLSYHGNKSIIPSAFTMQGSTLCSKHLQTESLKMGGLSTELVRVQVNIHSLTVLACRQRSVGS